MRWGSMVLGAVAFAAALHNGALAQDAPRWHQLSIDEMNAEQREVAEIALKSPAGIGGPFNIVFRDPELAKIFLAFGDRVVKESPLPLALRELAIIISARYLNTQQIWSLHAPVALRAGLSADVVEAIRLGRRPEAMTVDEAIIFDYCVETFRDFVVSDSTFARAKARFGEAALVNLSGLLGFEGLVTSVVKSAAIPIPGTSDAATLVPVNSPFARR